VLCQPAWLAGRRAAVAFEAGMSRCSPRVLTAARPSAAGAAGHRGHTRAVCSIRRSDAILTADLPDEPHLGVADEEDVGHCFGIGGWRGMGPQLSAKITWVHPRQQTRSCAWWEQHTPGDRREL
jgi:hypothetical protein